MARLLLTVAFAAVLAGCVSTDIQPLGRGTYLVIAEGGAGHSGAALMKKMLAAANEYCLGSKQEAVVGQYQAEGGSFVSAPYVYAGKAAGGQLQFHCE